jgi:hypothetical protein
MFDSELIVEALAKIMQERIAAVAIRHFQMRGQRGLGGADRPNMQIMYRSDVRECR